MKRTFFIIPILLVINLFLAPMNHVRAQTPSPVVHAALFYSPDCPHCQYVITEALTPLLKKYGNQLQIIAVDVNQPQGQTLFIAALKKFGVEEGGVPFLVFDNTYLMGSQDIPEKFPGLIESYLSKGGVDWPAIPGLREALLATTETQATAAPVQPATPQASLTAASPAPSVVSPTAISGLIQMNTDVTGGSGHFAVELTGNTLAVLVLIGMLGCVVWAIALFQKTNGSSLKNVGAWVTPVICAAEFGVAGYLAYVETTGATAVCGPIGDCNMVQHSPYARLFGILPIGMLGLAGNAMILVAWLVAHYGRRRLAALATISLFGMTASGTLFSIYLTYLEPFVIGATCAWCLTSSVLMTTLMLLSVEPARAALSKYPFAATHRRRYARIGVHRD